MEIPYGFCQCGCGLKTSLARQTDNRWGHIKDEPTRFIVGHNVHVNRPKQTKGPKHPRWVINRQSSLKGRPTVRILRGDKYIFIPKSVFIAEKILGKQLPPKAKVHHINGKNDDNRPENLVICENHAYHMLIHQRLRAFKACGHAHWLKCTYCKQWDAPENLYISPNQKTKYHRHCHRLRYSAIYSFNKS